MLPALWLAVGSNGILQPRNQFQLLGLTSVFGHRMQRKIWFAFVPQISPSTQVPWSHFPRLPWLPLCHLPQQSLHPHCLSHCSLVELLLILLRSSLWMAQVPCHLPRSWALRRWQLMVPLLRLRLRTSHLRLSHSLARQLLSLILQGSGMSKTPDSFHPLVTCLALLNVCPLPASMSACRCMDGDCDVIFLFRSV